MRSEQFVGECEALRARLRSLSLLQELGNCALWNRHVVTVAALDAQEFFVFVNDEFVFHEISLGSQVRVRLLPLHGTNLGDSSGGDT